MIITSTSGRPYAVARHFQSNQLAVHPILAPANDEMCLILHWRYVTIKDAFKPGTKFPSNAVFPEGSWALSDYSARARSGMWTGFKVYPISPAMTKAMASLAIDTIKDCMSDKGVLLSQTTIRDDFAEDFSKLLADSLQSYQCLKPPKSLLRKPLSIADLHAFNVALIKGDAAPKILKAYKKQGYGKGPIKPVDKASEDGAASLPENVVKLHVD